MGGAPSSGNGQERLIFPLLAEPTPRPRWVSQFLVGTAILALLSFAVLVAVSQSRPAPAGKLAVGGTGLDGRQLDRTGNRGRASVFDLDPGACLWDYEVLKWSYVGPSATRWAVRDDRVVACLVVGVDEPFTGSLLVQR